MTLPPIETWETTKWLKKEIDDIRFCRKEDTHGWLYKV